MYDLQEVRSNKSSCTEKNFLIEELNDKKGQKAQSILSFGCFSTNASIIIHVRAFIRNIPDFRSAEIDKLAQNKKFFSVNILHD